MKFGTVKGMRDFLPEQARKKQFIEGLCRRTFELYGFEPLQTPVVEDFALLSAKGSGGEAIKDEIYCFRDKGDRELGLRYDLTVPLARVAATNPSLPRPFKRYCIGTVYRYDRPQAKRYREFTQADFDILGSKSPRADFEILEVACDVMRSLGLEFKIKLNNRQVLEELCIKCGITAERTKDAFRSIDKLDKIGEKGVRAEFAGKNINERIIGMIFANSLDDVKAELGSAECMNELSMLLDMCSQNGLKEVAFDLSLARGLEYYTGSVFEVSLREGPSVGGGGRYDKLVETYGGQPTPAVGCSFGIDRLLDSLETSLIAGKSTDIFIAAISESAQAEASKLASALRRAGLCVETDVVGRNIKKNIEYADKNGITFFAAIGDDEIKSGRLRIKDMSNRSEKEFSFGNVKGICGLVRGG